VLRVEVAGTVVAGALSADGKLLAVTAARRWRPAMRRDRRRPGTISIVELPSGTLTLRHRTYVRGYAGLLYAGPVLYAVDSSLRPDDEPEWGDPVRRAESTILCCEDGRTMARVVDTNAPISGMSAHGRGFVTITAEASLGSYGPAQLRTSLMAMQPWDRYAAVAGGQGDLIALAHEDTGVTVMKVSRADPPRSVARLPVSGRRISMCFDGTDLIVAGRRGMAVYPVEEDQGWQPEPRARAAVPRARCPVVVPARDEICVLDRSGKVTYLDRQTLAPVRKPRELTGRTGTVLWAAPGNGVHALGGHGFVDVVTPECMAQDALAARSLSAWQPADLATARWGAAHIAARWPRTRPWYDLLVSCLEHRYGADAGIGSGPWPAR
jgi:hypothetical protein